MKFHGIQLQEGSTVKNLTVDSGATFPVEPNIGELFFLSAEDLNVNGLYVYINGDWQRIGVQSQAELGVVTVPTSDTRPSSPQIGQLQFNSSTRALEVFDGVDWATCAMAPVDPDPVAMSLIFGN